MGHGVKIGVGIAIGVVLIGVIALGACGVACVGLVGGGAALDRQSQPQKKTIKPGEVGQRMEQGGIALTVEKTTRAQLISYSKPGAGHVFIVVDLLIENTDKQNASINARSFQLKDSDGREYTWISTGTPGFITMATLIPADKLRGKLAFEVQKQPNSYVMSYAPLRLFGDDDPIRVSFKSE